VDHAVVPVIDDICSAEERITKYREVISESAQDAKVRVRNVPNKIVVAHINDLITKREVEGATLTRIQAVNHVQVSVRGVLGGREGRNEVLHDGSGQGAECISAVQQERLTLATTRRAVDGYHVTVRLVDRDAVGVDPEPGEAVGRLRGGDNGTLDEVTRVLLGVDAAKDYGSSCAVKTPEVHAEGSAVGESLLGKGVNNQRVTVLPPLERRPGTHKADDRVGTVERHAKDLLRDPGRSNADVVGHVLKVSVTGSVGDLALHAEVHQGGRLGEAWLSIAEVGGGGLGTNGVYP